MFFRLLGVYLAGSLLRLVLRLVLWPVVLFVTAALPGVLWVTYIDPNPSPHFIATLNITMLILVGGAVIVAVVRRRRERRRVHQAVDYILDVKHGRM